jgi:hypothetical protein
MGRLMVLESLLLACLLLLAGYVFWETLGAVWGLDGVWQDLVEERASDKSGLLLFLLVLFAIFCVPISIYWALQFWGMTRASFWIVTLATMVPQIPAVISYNRLDWPTFWTGPLFTTSLSQLVVASLFLASLALMAALHRTGELRRLRARLASLRLDQSEQQRAIISEQLVLVGLIGTTLTLTVALMCTGLAVAQLKDLLALPPWTVFTVGAAASLVLAAALALWLRQTGRE